MESEPVEMQEEQLPHQQTAGDEEVCVNSRNPQSVPHDAGFIPRLLSAMRPPATTVYKHVG